MNGRTIRHDAQLEGILDFNEDIENRDPLTRGHSFRVTRYAVIIANGMGRSKSEIETVHQAAHVHDIGKDEWTIEDFQAKTLTPVQVEKIRRHPVRGAEMLQEMGASKEICDIVRYHHERFDGQSVKTTKGKKHVGYPGEVRGDKIPLPSRIISPVDTFDALTAFRRYQPKVPISVAREELKRCAGIGYNRTLIPGEQPEMQFDPEIVRVFLGIATVGSSKSKIEHAIGCPYVHRIDTSEIVIEPIGYNDCKVCKNLN
ncbi:HD-GYP domain-containing protein [Nanoarchaeota archaeon]